MNADGPYFSQQDVERLADAAVAVLRWESDDPEPCWRCSGGGVRCEDRLGELVDCRCCGGTGSHCRTVQSRDGTIACVDHHPKVLPDECQSDPELYAALAPWRENRTFRASEEER